MQKFFKKSHYDWLAENLQDFYKKLNIDSGNRSIIAHGDKCYGYRDKWNEANIPFPHGVAIYLLTYEKPFDKESRNTKNGWVDPWKWVIDNYKRFKPLLNEVGDEYV